MNPNNKSRKLDISSPSWRYDIEIEADLVEELARLEGYDTLPILPLEPKATRNRESKDSMISTSLVSQGFNAVINYSFISEEDEIVFGESKKMIELENPISQNMKYMRSSLFPCLLYTSPSPRDRG